MTIQELFAKYNDNIAGYTNINIGKKQTIPYCFIHETGLYLFFNDAEDLKTRIYAIAGKTLIPEYKMKIFRYENDKFFYVENFKDNEIENIEEFLEDKMSGDFTITQEQADYAGAIFETGGKYATKDGTLYVKKEGRFFPCSDIIPEEHFNTTLKFGWLGFHKFKEGKKLIGLIYFLTFGLCGVGWCVDLLSMILGIYKDKDQLYLGPVNNKKKKLLFLLLAMILSFPLALLNSIIYKYIFALLSNVITTIAL